KNLSDHSKAILKIEVTDPTGKLQPGKILESGSYEGEKILFTQSIKKPILWSPDQPNLYTCKVSIETPAGIQTMTEKFGFRNFEFLNKGPFHLNGSRLLLRGTHRHEDHAGMAAAMTENL
ncbi:glycoside hydrolase family 2, partial [bacterium]|nr:glycoside hydrolase family 2 [bacterium]